MTAGKAARLSVDRALNSHLQVRADVQARLRKVISPFYWSNRYFDHDIFGLPFMRTSENFTPIGSLHREMGIITGEDE